VVGGAEQQAHALLVVLAQRVDRRQHRRLVLGRRQRRQRLAARAGGLFPCAALELLARALDDVRHAVTVRSGVEALAVDGHAGGDDQLLDGVVQQRLQQDAGSQAVDARVVGDLVRR